MRELNPLEMGMRVRRQRELLGYTREQLAEMLDVSVKFCSDIELGVKGVSLKNLVKLSKILHVTTDYILIGESDTTSDTLSYMCQSCPENHRTNLIKIVKAFLDAIENI